MNFTSDNSHGVSEPILRALARANEGTAESYGADALSAAVEKAFCALFEREVAVIQVATGTAANALAIAAYTPPYGAVLCHRDSHVMTDECGAGEFYSGGAKLAGLDGEACKIAPATLSAALARMPGGDQHRTPPALLSLTQASEAGTLYSAEEIAILAKIAHERGLAVHMDGARFANALVSLDVSPAEMTWKAGVDVLSFGATKNVAMAAEALVLFDPERAQELVFRRKRAGHLLSKSRFLAAQLLAYLEDGHWLAMARHANALARRLGNGLAQVPGVRLAWPVEANEVFAILPLSLDARLRAGGARYHSWLGHSAPPSGLDSGSERFVRLVTSGLMDGEEVGRLLDLARGDG